MLDFYFSTPFPNNDRHIIEDSNVEDSDKTADDRSFSYDSINLTISETMLVTD
jgi:hypothetical protein